MFCKNCGKEVNEKAVVCIHCGCAIEQPKIEKSNSTTGEEKTTIGIIMAIFLGLIGLVIGLLLYPSATVERDTFVKGWVKGFVAMLIISVVLAIFVAALI